MWTHLLHIWVVFLCSYLCFLISLDRPCTTMLVCTTIICTASRHASLLCKRVTCSCKHPPSAAAGAFNRVCSPARGHHERSFTVPRGCRCDRGSRPRDDVRVLSHVPFLYVARPLSPAACHHRRRRRSTVAIGLLLLQGERAADGGQGGCKAKKKSWTCTHAVEQQIAWNTS